MKARIFNIIFAAAFPLVEGALVFASNDDLIDRSLEGSVVDSVVNPSMNLSVGSAVSSSCLRAVELINSIDVNRNMGRSLEARTASCSGVETTKVPSKFPCDLSQFGSLPRIIVHKDIRNYVQGAPEESRDGKFLRSLVSAATQYAAFVDLFYNLGSDSGNDMETMAREFFQSLLQDPYREEAWKAIKRPIKTEGFEEFAKRVDELVSARRNVEAAAKVLKSLQNDRLFKDRGALWKFLKFSRNIADEQRRLAEDKYSTIDLQLYDEFIKKPGDESIGMQFLNKYALHLKNGPMPKPLAQLACDSAEEGQDLHIVMTDEDVPSLRNLLIRASDPFRLEMKDPSWSESAAGSIQPMAISQ